MCVYFLILYLGLITPGRSELTLSVNIRIINQSIRLASLPLHYLGYEQLQVLRVALHHLIELGKLAGSEEDFG